MGSLSTPLEMLDPAIDPSLIVLANVEMEAAPMIVVPHHALTDVAVAQATVGAPAAQATPAVAAVVVVVPSNPLAPASEQRAQRRSRIPVPSGW